MAAGTLELSGKTVAVEFERRAARASMLADASASARDVLRFATVLLKAQGVLARHLSDVSPLTGRVSEDASIVAGLSRPLLEAIEQRAPSQLAGVARDRLSEDNSIAEERLAAFWADEASARDDYLSRAILRPYTEVLRARQVAPDRVHEMRHCPFCGAAALIAIRRPLPGSDASAFYLGCGLCGCEWIGKRSVCTVCSEEDPAKLPIFRSETHRETRIEACETCSSYIKSIDLTVDPRAIPEVDDLASISMDLWAADQGFTRVEPGIAGV